MPADKRFLTGLLLPLCFGSSLILGCGGSGDLPAPAGEMDDASGYRRLMEAARIPGLGVAVLENGEVMRATLFGAASAETGEAVSEETLFEAASLSKPVFGTAVLRLAQ